MRAVRKSGLVADGDARVHVGVRPCAGCRAGGHVPLVRETYVRGDASSGSNSGGGDRRAIGRWGERSGFLRKSLGLRPDLRRSPARRQRRSRGGRQANGPPSLRLGDARDDGARHRRPTLGAGVLRATFDERAPRKSRSVTSTVCTIAAVRFGRIFDDSSIVRASRVPAAAHASTVDDRGRLADRLSDWLERAGVARRELHDHREHDDEGPRLPRPPRHRPPWMAVGATSR